MPASTPLTPPGLPQLSAGSHPRPAEGGCFMEVVALLAGEPWSDRPACTHPLVAETARLVNDQLSDARRNELLTRVPDVIDTDAAGPVITSALLDELVRRGGRGAELAETARRRAREPASAGALPLSRLPLAQLPLARLHLARLHRAWLRRRDRRLVRRGMPELLVPLTQAVAREGGDRALIALLDGLIDAYWRAVGSRPSTASPDLSAVAA